MYILQIFFVCNAKVLSPLLKIKVSKTNCILKILIFVQIKYFMFQYKSNVSRTDPFSFWLSPLTNKTSCQKFHFLLCIQLFEGIAQHQCSSYKIQSAHRDPQLAVWHWHQKSKTLTTISGHCEIHTLRLTNTTTLQAVVKYKIFANKIYQIRLVKLHDSFTYYALKQFKYLFKKYST